MRRLSTLFLVTSCACAGASSQPRAQAEGDLSIRQFDADNDGKPEVTEYGREVPDPENPKRPRFLAVRRELDLNRDGKVDMIRRYAMPEHALAEEELDLDFDGKFDAKNFLAGGQLVRQEIDQNYDGKPDLIRFFERGRLVRKEIDRRRLGRPDYFEYYESGELDRIGIDENGDGTIDTWEQRREPAAALPSGQ